MPGSTMSRVFNIVAAFCLVSAALALPPEFEKEDSKPPPPGVSRFGDTEDYRYKWKVDPTNNSTIKPGTEFFTPKFGHQQKREGDRTSGRYYVYLGDGRLQIVDYNVSKTGGYKAEIRYVDQQRRNEETLRQEAARAGNSAATPAAAAATAVPAQTFSPITASGSAGAIPNTQGFFETLVPVWRGGAGTVGGTLLSNAASLASNVASRAARAVEHPHGYQFRRPTYATAAYGQSSLARYQYQQPQYYQQPSYQTIYQQPYASHSIRGR